MLQTKTSDYIMRGIYLLSLLFIILAGGGYAQAQCFDNNIRLGRQKMARGDYRGARLDFIRSQKCPDAQSAIANRYIQTCDAKLKQQEQQRLAELKERRAKAEKEQSTPTPPAPRTPERIRLTAIPAPAPTIAPMLSARPAKLPYIGTEGIDVAQTQSPSKPPRKAQPIYLGIGAMSNIGYTPYDNYSSWGNRLGSNIVLYGGKFVSQHLALNATLEYGLFYGAWGHAEADKDVRSVYQGYLERPLFALGARDNYQLYRTRMFYAGGGLELVYSLLNRTKPICPAIFGGVSYLQSLTEGQALSGTSAEGDPQFSRHSPGMLSLRLGAQLTLRLNQQLSLVAKGLWGTMSDRFSLEASPEGRSPYHLQLGIGITYTLGGH